MGRRSTSASNTARRHAAASFAVTLTPFVSSESACGNSCASVILGGSKTETKAQECVLFVEINKGVLYK